MNPVADSENAYLLDANRRNYEIREQLSKIDHARDRFQDAACAISIFASGAAFWVGAGYTAELAGIEQGVELGAALASPFALIALGGVAVTLKPGYDSLRAQRQIQLCKKIARSQERNKKHYHNSIDNI